MPDSQSNKNHEISRLRLELDDLRATVSELQTKIMTAPSLNTRPAAALQAPEAVSRRSALRTAGMVAAGALASGAAIARSATPAGAYTDAGSTRFAATASENGIVAATNTAKEAILVTAARGSVGLSVVAEGPSGPGTENWAIEAISNDGFGVYASSLEGVGIYGMSSNGRGVVGESVGSQAGVHAISDSGPGLFADSASGAGVRIRTERAALSVRPFGFPAPYRSDPHGAGDFIVDSDATLWYAAKGPGGVGISWRKLAGTTSAGTFHAIAPARVYDSRQTAYPINGPMTSGTDRTVLLGAKRDLTGNVILPNIVPVGASAVAANVTVARTTGTNYLCINPGGNTTIPASTINWFASGQTLANGVVLTLNSDREVTIVAGAQGGSAHVIIDVTGYWL